MKILHFNTTDFQGGAAKATYRLHKALLLKGIHSDYYVQHKELSEYSIHSKNQPLDKLFKQVIPFIDRTFLSLIYRIDPIEIFSPALFATDYIVQIIERYKPDIIHLNWISGSFINPVILRRIKIPIVWTMHDSWVFTGGCHLPYDCKKYMEKCGCCPKLQSNSKHDISFRLLRKKKNDWNNINITFVAPSSWLYNCARVSSLLAGKRVILLPNGIDSDFFQPVEKVLARQILGLDPYKKYILFGAVNSFSDSNKGYDYLLSSLKKLSLISKSDIELLIIGMGDQGQKMDINYKIHYCGKIHDEISMKLLFSAANLTIVPSLSENLSYMIMESMCVGTPVAAFDVGGNSDLIEHLKNGFLAQPKNGDELAEGMQYLLDDNNSERLKESARTKIVTNFDREIILKKYLELYESILFK